jgi:hypothetical protein
MRTVQGAPPLLDRHSVASALADYLLQVNYQGYRPDMQKALWVRKSDRTATVRDAGLPVRGETFYFIEGELFPEAGDTRLQAGESPLARAERLLDRIWDDLWVWNAYDFARSTSGMNAP